MRKIAPLTLICLALLGGAAYAVTGGFARSSAGHTAQLSPNRQSVVHGQQVRSSLTIRRQGGFAGRVSVGFRKLPRGIRARFELHEGTRTKAVPANANGGIIVVKTSRRMRSGTRTIRVVTKGGGKTRTKKLKLTVLRGKGSFRIFLTPLRQTVSPGKTATVGVRIKRDHNYRGRVRLKVQGAPKGYRRIVTRGGISRSARAQLVVPAAARPTLVRLVVIGKARVHGKVRTRYQVASIRVRGTVNSLSVQRVLPLEISGGATALLTPGKTVPLALTLTNRNRADMLVTELGVSLRAGKTARGCDIAANYFVKQYSGPGLRIAPGASTLAGLAVPRAQWPQLGMRNTARNQDACKGARLTLDYTGKGQEA